ncbi:MAG TPA: thioesterase family protein [Salinivirgaceae bacterium]|nr:thioesterase family protein [Salinivirgaceae bacterium]
MRKIENITEFRIRYVHTDQMGIVYYGNYAMLYEIGRTELMRSIGIAYRDLEESGIMMPVIEMKSKYKRPLYYDEVIQIKTVIDTLPTASIIFRHEIFNSKGELCNLGEVTLGFINKVNKRPTRVPSKLLELLNRG